MDIFLSASLLASYASYHSYRARDIKFFYELFNNWFATMVQDTKSIQIIQIQRYLDKKIKKGEVIQAKAERFKYTLSPIGILSTLKEVFESSDEINPNESFFRIYFISSYAPKFISLMDQKHMAFPFLVKDEIQMMLSTKRIFEKEFEKIDKAERVFKERRDSALACAKFVEKRTSEVNFLNLLSEVEEKFPYEMNPVKPLSKLISELPTDFQKIEITSGMKKRATQLWNPVLENLSAYKNNLLQIQNNMKV